jgi:hypothetical protein
MSAVSSVEAPESLPEDVGPSDPASFGTIILQQDILHCNLVATLPSPVCSDHNATLASATAPYFAISSGKLSSGQR